MTDGFLASGTEDDEFIRSELNNPQWDSQFMEIKENFIEPDEKMGEKFGFEIRTNLEEGEYVEGNALTVEPEYGAPASSSYYVEGNKHKLNKFPRQHYYWSWTVRK